MADKKDAGPLLDLTTLIERSQVRIDGQLYDLLDAGELSLLQYHRLVRLGARLDDMQFDTEEQCAEVSRALDEFCRLVLVAPKEVQDKLSDGRRNQIVSVFMKLLRAWAAEATPAVAESSTTVPTETAPELAKEAVQTSAPAPEPTGASDGRT
jgi:hypothetical protein